MARKSIKGYAEKNYYDNIRFNGIVATNDPLNEGSFKHLVNFDIADTGQSLTPRKGFLTTTLKYNPEYTIPKDLKVSFDGESLYITGYAGSLKNINIPTNMIIDNRIHPIIGVGDAAFSQKDIENIILNDGIEYISGFAFYHCDNLTSITLPNTLTSIGESVFSGCVSLENINIPEGIASVANRLFEYCENLTNISLPESITRIGISTFSGCSSLKLSKLPNNLKVIERGAFSYCKNITKLALPEGLDTIESNAFEYCTGLQKIYIPQSVTKIQKDAFKGCAANLIIYCEAEDVPDTWDPDWNPKGCPLIEDASLDDFNLDLNESNEYINPSNSSDSPEIEISISNKCIYYFDANISKWVFIDLNNYNAITDDLYIPDVYLVDFSVEDNYIKDVHKVSRVEFIDIKEPWSNYIEHSSIKDTIFFSEMNVYNNQALPAIDEYGITHNIIKIYKGVDIGWLSFNYRKDDSEYEGQQYLSDTLVISMLDTEDIVDSVNTANRNIASFKSIIPNPMQAVYNEDEKPLGFIQKFPMIYAKQKNKYLINNIDDIDDLELIPNFYLKEFDNNIFTYEGEDIEKYTWAYAYTISKNSIDSGILDSSSVHNSPIFDLRNNKVLLGYMQNFMTNYTTDLYLKIVKNTVFTTDLVVNNKVNKNVRTYAKATYDTHQKYIKYLDIIKNTLNVNYSKDNTLLIYMIPKTTTSLIEIPKGMFYFKNGMSILHTAWYSNTKYTFTDEVLNIPEITNALFDGVEGAEVLKDLPKLTASQAEVVYAKYVDTYSIYTHCTKGTSFDDFYSTVVEEGKHYTDKVYNLNIIKNFFTQFDANYYFVTIPVNKITQDYTEEHAEGYYNIKQTALHSPIIAFPANIIKNAEELITYIENDHSIVDLCIRYMENSVGLRVQEKPTGNNLRSLELRKLFPGITEIKSTDVQDYLVGFNNVCSTTISSETHNWPREFSNEGLTDSIVNLFNVYNPLLNAEAIELSESHLSYLPCLDYFAPNGSSFVGCNLRSFEIKERKQLQTSLFTMNNGLLTAHLNDTNELYKALKDSHYFDQGITLTMYLLSMPSVQYIAQAYPEFNSYTREYFINTTSLVQSRQLIIDNIEPTTYVEYLTEYPNLIKYAKEYFVFNSTLGDHLVTYTDNKVFISKPGLQYYFTEDNVYSFPETIVKALQYKDTILVFTTQNLYSIYLTEYVTNVPNGTDEEGNIKYVQQTTYVFATLPVLYNLLVDSRYKDAIQVYNQMILFYSADGQMFLIKPTAAIDSNTRFSIQYFNKSANDILLNYKEYMQERLGIYGVDKVIDEVNIKVSTSVNYIKIFYSAPNIMTYILIYDIINNRYYVYDTLAFTNVKSLHNIPMGEMYIVEDDKRLYFTLPNNNINELDTNVDISSFDNFNKNPIKCEIDTGTINLNNHLKKRFKELHVTYKNLSSSILEFSLDTFVDEVPIITYLSTTLEIKDILGSTTLVPVNTINSVNLIESNTLLFNFTDYTSNKFITHKSNITSRGKTIRTKLYFSSKGKYKIQGFGLIYKEHTV